MRPCASMSMFVGLWSIGERAHSVTSRSSGTANWLTGTKSGAGSEAGAGAGWAKALEPAAATDKVIIKRTAGKGRMGRMSEQKRREGHLATNVSGIQCLAQELKDIATPHLAAAHRESTVSVARFLGIAKGWINKGAIRRAFFLERGAEEFTRSQVL